MIVVSQSCGWMDWRKISMPRLDLTGLLDKEVRRMLESELVAYGQILLVITRAHCLPMLSHQSARK